MGRAEDLFRRLSEGGEAAIDALVADRQSEELFLDFKRSADSGAGSRLHDDDRGNLAKAISGFGNSEGGVVIWGVDTSRLSREGDVASAKVPIENPRRLLSWIGGAVSGCTLPPHPNVRSVAIIRSDEDRGFVITYMSKSSSAPHQCIRPPQFYIRSGSSFVPAPYGVLAGLFGRRPEPAVFHMWSTTPVAYQRSREDRPLAAEFVVGFVLANDGPGIARDLYVNGIFAPPGPNTTIALQVTDRSNWTGQFAYGFTISLVSIDAFKLAPKASVEPLHFLCSFAPPFDHNMFYRINFGAQGTPVRTIEAHVSVAILQAAFDAYTSSVRDRPSGERFIQTAMSIPESRPLTVDEAYGADS
jgi:hypothetical protein